MAKILVIDNDIKVQLVLQGVLEGEGHEVVKTDTGKDGLSQAESWVPDLILCEGIVPDLDGLAVCHQVKANLQQATTFFILMIGPDRDLDRAKGLEMGVDDFLNKPIVTEELLARVRTGLRLRSVTQQLEGTVQDLQQTQSQFMQSEKMSSLGRLVAGIAHEINNPITFIYSNLVHVQSYAGDLIELLRLYQNEFENPSPKILQKQQEMELDFLVDDLSKIMNSMRTGSDRIHKIIVALQEFSRTDRSGWQPIDIHTGLDNTTLMLQHRLSAREGRPDIKIVKDYRDLPLIECYAGQLSEAFLNILNNAIDAIEAAGDKFQAFESDLSPESESDSLKPIVRIRTEVVDENYILIAIADNGIGMDESLKVKIFEPFFTTKPTGEGTGLGLSISHQIIVQQHQGTLSCSSQLGKGSEFLMTIPMRHS